MNNVAFITGASRGIGRATALSFAQRGFDVVLSARTLTAGEKHEHALTTDDGVPLAGSLSETATLVEKLGRKAWTIRMDLLDEESVLSAAAAAIDQAGRVDVLVNNAVYQGRDLNSSFMELGADTLGRVYRGYLLAPFLLSQRIAAHMAERGNGVIVNITSGAGETDPPVAAGKGGWGYAYGAGKAVVSRLAGVITTELGGQGVRAYTVNPGVVTTEALKATIGEKGVIALRHGSAPPEVPAEVICWLACEDVEGVHQKKTINAQSLALKQKIIADWRV